MKLDELFEEVYPADDEKLIRRVIRDADAALKKEGDGGDYKEYELDMKQGILWWIAQGNRNNQGAADTIAHYFDSADIVPFTIKVIGRDEWNGEFGQQKTAISKLTDDPEMQAAIEKRTKKTGGWATAKVK